MKKLVQICLLWAGLAYGSAIAQSSPTLQLSPEVKGVSREYMRSMMFQVGDNFYYIKGSNAVLRQKKHEVRLHQINTQTWARKENTLELAIGDKKLDFEGSFTLNKAVFLKGRYFDRKTDQTELYLFELNPQSLSFVGSPKKIMQVKTPSTWVSADFFLEFSPESDYLLIGGSSVAKKDDPERLKFKVYNREMELLWEKSDVLDFEDKLFSIRQIEVSSSGYAYVFGKKYFNKAKSTVQGAPNYEYVLLEYTPDGKRRETSFGDPDKFLHQITLCFSPEGDLLFTGLYSELGTNSAKGTFTLSIKPGTSKILWKQFSPFQADLFKGDVDREGMEKWLQSGREINNMDLRSLWVGDDGSIHLVGEHYSATKHNTSTTTTTTAGATSTRYKSYTTYMYGPIYYIHIDPDGQIKWISQIVKGQVTRNKEDCLYFGFHLARIGDDVHIVFNDYDYRIMPPEQRPTLVIGWKKHACLLDVTIGPDGEQTPHVLTMTKGLKTKPIPQDGDGLGDSKVLIYFQKKNVEQFGLIQY